MTTTITAATTVSPPASRRRWAALVVLALAQLMVVLDATIVNIALPAAQHDLGFGDESRQWVITAYSLAFGGLLLLGGRISDLFGRKRSFLIGLVGFAAASVLGGWSPSFEILVTARALQGGFGALLAPAALSLLTVTFADSPDRGRAFGVYGAISGAGGAIGLLLGGVLTEYASWNWCLYVNVFFAFVSFAGAWWLLSERGRETEGPRLDWPGTVLVTAGLFSLVYGLSNSEVNGWSDGWTIGFIGAGAALLAAFVAVETRVAHPLLPMRILLDRVRGTSYLAMLIAAVGMFGVFLFLTYFLQSVLGYSPVVTGLAFLPMVAALAGCASLIGSLFLSRVSPKIIVGTGFAAAGAGMVLLTGISSDTGYVGGVLPALLILGAGLGAVFSAATSFSTLGVRAEDAGVASATVNTAQQIGGSIGISLLSSIAASAAADYISARVPATPSPATAPEAAMAVLEQGAQIASYQTAFWWAAGSFFAGAVLAGLLYPRKAPKSDPDAMPVIAH